MADGLHGLQVLDCVGVPEYFSTHVAAIEDAGGGLVRIVRCVERNGLLIPVFTCVTPAASILQNGPMFREIAEKVLCAMARDGDAVN